MKKVFLESRSLEESLRVLSELLKTRGIGRLPEETIPSKLSLGRITAAPVFARYSSPFYHSAAMDGFAVRFAETLTASEQQPALLKIGSQAVPVDTGDPMPEGFNAVIMIEDVNRSGDSIEIYAPATPYQHVRPIGEDIVATELIVPENHVLRPMDIGALLASGHIDVSVVRKPVVAIIPTGTELVEPEMVRRRAPVPPEIIEYNSAMLSGLAAELGAEPLIYPIIKDDFEKIKGVISEAAAKADIVLVNAGSGRGSEDFTAAAIAELGELAINSVSIKPGKPFIAGIIGNTPVLGIPGYPVSAFLTFRLYAQPLIERMLSVRAAGRDSIRATISRQISSAFGIDEFIRVKVGVVGDKHIATPAGRGAGLLMSLVRCDGMIKVPASSEGLAAGAEVEVELIRSKEDLRNTIVCIGSHDNSLDVLANSIKKNYPDLSLSSAHVGSMGGLIALKKGEAHMAGTHLLDEATGEYNVSDIKRLLPEKKIVLVNLVYRVQGFVVRKGNPKNIKDFGDLVRSDVIYINRQAGSGTRLLLDKHLRELGILPQLIKGYDHDEYTHMAVASAVLTGLADTGLAVYSSAKALDLDFIPVAVERYDIAIPADFINTEMIQRMLRIIREDSEFIETVQALGGYDTKDMGKVLYES
ncbi:MAG TPA: molybdopterin biosynthesis protein [Dissulfurispiraceae bacterium]|nr:molybdopterin biosynthesis protein [Dissulfurispiraceae bacterium]